MKRFLRSDRKRLVIIIGCFVLPPLIVRFLSASVPPGGTKSTNVNQGRRRPIQIISSLGCHSIRLDNSTDSSVLSHFEPGNRRSEAPMWKITPLHSKETECKTSSRDFFDHQTGRVIRNVFYLARTSASKRFRRQFSDDRSVVSERVDVRKKQRERCDFPSMSSLKRPMGEIRSELIFGDKNDPLLNVKIFPDANVAEKKEKRSTGRKKIRIPFCRDIVSFFQL